MYIHDRKTWPELKWNHAQVVGPLAEARHAQGRLLGRMASLGFSLREEASLEILTGDVVHTSANEGERLDARSVRSSIARKLGLESGGTAPADRQVDGIVDVMLDATRNYQAPLTIKRLRGWHAALFPTGRSGMRPIVVGRWRTEDSGPMRVVSGPVGHEKLHFEAPASERLDHEMRTFLDWFNDSARLDPAIKSAVAHFRFVTVHPFEDGNGRIARAIADMMLARSDGSDQRFYSMSSQIQRERKAYYDVLESCQKGSLDITKWIGWYLDCMRHAAEASDGMLKTTLAKADFWKKHATESFNTRQRKMFNRLLDGFEGKLTSSKWAMWTICSQDTALRDIADLVERGVLIKEAAGGRSTSYRLGG